MSEGIIVAIDGPAGSGKSSASMAAARYLEFGYIDSGSMYRAFALHGLHNGLNFADQGAVLGLWYSARVSISIDAFDPWTKLDGQDVSEHIREPKVDAVVADVAKVTGFRIRMNHLLRELIVLSPWPGIIVEGRDITTVVAPEAEVRILLTAREEVRIARRSGEHTGVPVSQLALDLRNRDRANSMVVEFMTAADGVMTIDSTDLGLTETVLTIVKAITSAQAELARITQSGEPADQPARAKS